MPKPPRFFISSDQVNNDEILVLGDDLRHIRTVLRKQPGDLLTLFDNQGMEYLVKISRIGKTEIRAEIQNRAQRKSAAPRIALGQGLPKSDKMDWIIQKTTELGVTSIAPLVTERTIVKVRDAEKRGIRWQKIAREAAMQSNRIDIPRVEDVRSFDDYLRTMTSDPYALRLLPWEESTRPLKDVVTAQEKIDGIVVLIGPEGGFSAAEADRAQAVGFLPVSLGPLILRTETAAVAVMSILRYEYGA